MLIISILKVRFVCDMNSAYSFSPLSKPLTLPFVNVQRQVNLQNDFPRLTCGAEILIPSILREEACVA